QDGANGATPLSCILGWTGGHPYLTQSLCALIRDRPPEGPPDENVDRVVQSEFLASGADKEERNLQFVPNYLTANPLRIPPRRLLQVNGRIRRGLPVGDDPRSRDHIELKLSGVVKPDKDDRLIVRNRIYDRVFNLDWIKAAIPEDPVRLWAVRTAVTSSVLLLL